MLRRRLASLLRAAAAWLDPPAPNGPAIAAEGQEIAARAPVARSAPNAVPSDTDRTLAEFERAIERMQAGEYLGRAIRRYSPPEERGRA